MCHVLNGEEGDRYEKLVYCLPPEILQKIFHTHHHNWMDKKKRRPHEINSLTNHNEYLNYIDREKLVSHRFLFAPVLHSEYWWLYVLDKSIPEMFVLDSKNIASPTDKRTTLNKFGPMLDEFRKKLVTKIIMSKENSMRADAITAAQNMRVTRLGAALRNPFIPFSIPDLPTK
ncbi:hypothetical protein PIB30_007194 [Stylosanthes scabra]|uniref:Ubiquitin-like protease family profile domain-containing protein n=1 Tax=Stylosanthes scabra TaxID=79078 RepID=A0ABU6U3E4_9FABA|nr:hypothetical protein [Stylosanthes scabra]